MWTIAVMAGLMGMQQGEPVFPATVAGAEIRLWEGAAPGALGEDEKDVPSLRPFLPAERRGSGAGVVVFPGGGYGGLAGHEGEGYARWLCGYGIAAFVVRYRLGSAGYRHPVMLEDAERALRVVRSRAADWGLDPDRVGVMGSSAGGHLAATVLTQGDRGDPDATDPVDRLSARPAFGILCYPVISMRDPLAHAGSRRNLLGEEPDPALALQLSNELQVRADTPPTFVWHTADDAAVPVGNSYAFAAALAEAGVPHELHVYPSGRHGLGLGVRDPAGRAVDELLPWTRACARWLAEVADGRSIGEGVPAELLRRAELATEALPPEEPQAADFDEGVRPVEGRVVARVGHAVVVRVERDPLHLVGEVVGEHITLYRASTYRGQARVVARSEAHLLAVLVSRLEGQTVSVGDSFIVF
jgi:acetyl esterase/lipase